MSDAMPYATRLRWHHTLGVARHDGVIVDLKRAPDLPSLRHMTEMDYIPGVIAEVRIGCELRRDLSPAEQIDALALLERMAAAARGVMG